MTPLQSQSFPPKVKSTGDVAITGYSVLARKSPVVLLQCRLYTGKTHQIRVHLKDALGIEILNDGKYGNRRLSRSVEMPIDRKVLYLHCWKMKLRVNGVERTVGFSRWVSRSSLPSCPHTCSPFTAIRIARFL